MRIVVGSVLIAISTTVLAQSSQPAPSPAAPKPLDAARFRPITGADLDKLPSGCSFAALRGKDMIAISVGDGPPGASGKPGQVPFWFKIDGRIVKASGTLGKKTRTQHIGSWTGMVAGHSVTITEGKLNPKVKNDGGGQGGAGTLEWVAGEAKGSLPVTWEAGC